MAVKNCTTLAPKHIIPFDTIQVNVKLHPDIGIDWIVNETEERFTRLEVVSDNDIDSTCRCLIQMLPMKRKLNLAKPNSSN